MQWFDGLRFEVFVHDQRKAIESIHRGQQEGIDLQKSYQGSVQQCGNSETYRITFVKSFDSYVGLRWARRAVHQNHAYNNICLITLDMVKSLWWQYDKRGYPVENTLLEIRVNTGFCQICNEATDGWTDN